MRSDDFVRNRSARHRDAHHVAARAVNGFAHRFRYFVRLSSCKTDAALPISHRDQRVEREAASTLHDLCDAVDRDHILDELASAFAATVTTSTITSLSVT